MVVQTHFINNQQVNLPRNWADLGLKANFNSNRDNEEMLSITQFVWDADALRLLNQLKSIAFQGIPHRIELFDERTGVTDVVFDGYIDLRNALFDLEFVEATSHYRLTLDWLSEVANGVDFATLYEKGFLSKSDIVFVPYLLDVTDYGNLLLISISLVFLINELQQVIIKFAPESTALIATMIEAVTGVVMLVFTIIYFVILIIAVTNLILDLLRYFVQAVKYKPGMKVLRLCEAGANYFGFQFKCDELSKSPYNQMVILPETFTNPEDENGLRGFFIRNPNQQQGYPMMNYGEFLEEVRKLINGRFDFVGNQLVLQPKTQITLSPSFRIQQLDQYEQTTNLTEIPSNFMFSFAYDVKDEKTITNWFGTNSRAVLTPKSITDRQLNLLRGFETVQSRFARGFQKTKFNTIERISLGFLKALDSLISGAVGLLNRGIRTINSILRTIERIRRALRVVGIKTNKPISEVDTVSVNPFQDKIKQRIGMLETTDDVTTVPKLVILASNNENISNLNEQRINAEYILRTYYLPIIHRQGYYKKITNVPMSRAQFKSIIQERAVFDITGDVAEVDEIEFNPENQLAQMRIFVPSVIDSNIEININTPTGL